MKNLSISKYISIGLGLSILLQSCASTTVINSEPQGAKVYINDEFAGTTPYVYSDEKIIFTTTYIRLEKDGYEPLSTEIERSEQADVGPIIAGFFVYVPWLWALKYKPAHSYQLKPATTPTPAPENAPATTDKYQKLRELKKLLDDGIITQEEFDREKKKILDEK